MSQNNITRIANKLEAVYEEISVLDKTDTYQIIASIQLAHNEIDEAAQENEISILRAIIHWMALNTEVDSDNEQQMATLIKNDSYTNWIDVLASMLRDNDFTLMPILHQSLTSPNWIVRPSVLLLKGVASWLKEIKIEKEQVSELQAEQNIIDASEDDCSVNNVEETTINHQISEQTEEEFGLIDSNQTDNSIEDIISKQILKAAEANQETLVHQTVFEEIDIETLEKKYIQNLALIEPTEEDETENFNLPLMETENSSLDDENFESIFTDTDLDIDLIDEELIESDLDLEVDTTDINLINNDLLIDEKLLAENDSLIESFIEEDEVEQVKESNLKENIDSNSNDDSLNLENDLMEIYQALMSASRTSDNVFSARNDYIKQLNLLTILTEASSLEAITAISAWCNNNIILFEANPTLEIKTFLSSGIAWSWIKELHDCLNDLDKNTCLNDLTNSLTHKEWLEPVDTIELEALLVSLKNTLNERKQQNTPEKNITNKTQQNSEFEYNLKNEDSLESYDMPQLIDSSILDTQVSVVEKSEKIEQSGLEVTWDDDTHPELLMVYLEETPTQIEELLPLLNKISVQEADEDEKSTASRLAHTIKGGSAIVGITALSEFAYRLETLIDHSIKHKLDDDILNTLPDAANCLQSLFDAVQLQQNEPANFLPLFKSLDRYVSNLEIDDEQLEISSAPVLPDFIIEQNRANDNSKSSSDAKEVQPESNELEEILDSHIETAELVESAKKSGFQLNWNDDTHPELLMVYLEETPTQINQLLPLMNKISNGSADSEDKHIASRMAHTIKGGSALVGITALSEFAYRLETILDHSIKYQLSENILDILPKAGSCLEELFEAVQMQDDEPSEYYSIFKQLNDFVDDINDSSQNNDEVLELSAPVLPDFILNQNNDFEEAVDIDNSVDLQESIELDDTINIEDIEDFTDLEDNINFIKRIDEDKVKKDVREDKITQNKVIESNEEIETISVETAKLEKLDPEEDVNNITEEISDIVMSLITISSNTGTKEGKLENYSLELQRFDLLTDISGYPELSLLTQWCQENLTLFAKNNQKETASFIDSGEIWSWMEYVGTALNDPNDMSHLSSLSVELMRDDWAQAIEMDDLQTVLLALRNLEEKNVTANAEYAADNTDSTDSYNDSSDDSNSNSNNDEIVSWDKDIHPELLAVYFKETPDQIYEVAGLLQKISKGESTTEENKTAARIAHTIKGASGVLGLNSLVELTHSLEDILDYSVSHEISAETAELLAEASDCMESLFETIQNKQIAPEELPSVLKRLLAFSGILDTNRVSTELVVNSESVNTEIQQKLSIETLTTSDSDNDTDIIKNIDANSTSDENPILQNNTSKVDLNQAYIRVPVTIIDRLLNLAGELVTTSSQVGDDLAKSIAINKVNKTQDDRVNHMLGELSNTITQQEKDQHKLLSSLEDSNFDTLEMDTYNELHSVASLLSESFLDSQDIDNTLNKQLNALSDKLRSLDKLNKDFSDVILSSRMVSINSIIPRLERIVRQTCRKTNKKAELVVTGNNINIDTDILNGLIDPLLHMLRNSIDHGIESPAERTKADKDETGLIELSFTRDGNNVSMSLKDDGAGINPETIYQKAIEKELITPDQEFSKQDMLKLILQPGFSTQKSVTDISGRGVGMDVVNSSVHDLNGSLVIDSEVGEGTTLNLKIPLTLITNTTLLVKAAENTVAIPVDSIEQIIYQEANQVITHDGSYFVLFEEQELEIKPLAKLLNWSNEAVDYSQSSNILIIKSDNKTHAIHVDKILSSREVVVKPLNPWISPVKGVIGACHLNDGGVAPVINLLRVVKQARKHKVDATNKQTEINTPTKSHRTAKILVVDDSLSNRKALSLIIDKTEYDVVTAVDGMDALQIMNEQTIDLVFTDLEMPRMNGIELTQAIRAWSSKSKTPIVMITSRTTNKHRELAAKAGVDDYLTKPVVTEILLGSMNQWLIEKTPVEA